MANKKLYQAFGFCFTRLGDAPNIRQVWEASYQDYCLSGKPQTGIQAKASRAILGCKTGAFGCSISTCPDCGHVKVHYNSCRNRSCPNCQAVSKEVWVDARSAEVIDAPYFHVVFTLPHELNSLIYGNQKLLYGLLHKCCSQTLLELAADPKYLGAQPGIIQVLHTWNQELGYHVHMHCIISGGGLTRCRKLLLAGPDFFIPVRVLRDKFKGKFLALLDAHHKSGDLAFPPQCRGLSNYYHWKEFKNCLYAKDWCPYIAETFNGFGNAMEYLGRYTHKVAISNSRLISVTETHTTFSARGRRPGEGRRRVTLPNQEFIRRFLMHVLPHGFQKIRYYGFLNNRSKTENLKLIFRLQGRQRFQARYAGMSIADLMKAVWDVDICLCPVCGRSSMRPSGRTYNRLC